MQPGPEKDFLGNSIPQTRDDLILREQSLHAALLHQCLFSDEIGKAVKGELRLNRRGIHPSDLYPVLFFSLLVKLHNTPQLSPDGEEGTVSKLNKEMMFFWQS
jgi:hypothetical protein